MSCVMLEGLVGPITPRWYDYDIVLSFLIRVISNLVISNLIFCNLVISTPRVTMSLPGTTNPQNLPLLTIGPIWSYPEWQT